jgi:hypothetical protein
MSEQNPRDREERMSVECAGAGDDDEFDVIRNCYISYMDMDATPCRHAFDIVTENHSAYPNDPYQKKGWYLPWAVQAFNQGGHDCTVVCLDCAEEAMARFVPL